MLTRFKGYSDGDVALIGDFLTETADEMPLRRAGYGAAAAAHSRSS
jgi:hypothetical protein